MGPAGPPGPAGPSGAEAYARTKIITASESPEQNGAQLRLAFEATGQASASSPWLIYLEPGVYDLGNTKLEMKPFVDIQGSGERVTILRLNGAPLVGANDVELRSLTVDSTSSAGGAEVVAIFNDQPRFRVRDVAAVASGGINATIAFRDQAAGATVERLHAVASSSNTTSNTVGYQCLGCNSEVVGVVAEAQGGNRTFGMELNLSGLDVSKGMPLLRDITASGAGAKINYGVGVSNGPANLVRVRAQAAGTNSISAGLLVSTAKVTVHGSQLEAHDSGDARGLWADVSADPSSVVEVHDSKLVGSTASVWRGSGINVRLAHTQVSGGKSISSTSGGGTMTCFAVYNDSFANAAGVTACP